MVKRKVLVPNYYDKFKCDGKKCEDSCCVGNWTIIVDKKHYKKLKKINHKDKELKYKIDKYFKRKRNNSLNDEFYGVLKQDLSLGQCVFLTNDKLCELQLNLGPEYLCNTCKDYPRNTNVINGNIERGLTLSCPIAARLILLNQEGISFKIIEEYEEREKIESIIFSNSDYKFNNTALKFFDEIRIFSIQILKSRDYKLWERLIILGLFCEKVQKYKNQGKVDLIPQLIMEYTDLIIKGIFKDNLKNIPSINTLQLNVLIELVDERFKISGINNSRYLDCLEEIINGMEYSAKTTMEQIGNNYKKAFEKYYSPFMNDNEYILENYLVNFIFKYAFPFEPRSKSTNIMDAYTMTIMQYALIKLHLIGMSAYYKENFNEEHVIKLIQSFVKVSEHNKVYLLKIHDLLKKSSFDTMAHMAILIKN